MKTLRVLLTHAPSPELELAWALFDTAGACTATGHARPAALPGADRLEAVVAASQVRITTVVLPPMAASRLANAAKFALEDQIAGPPEAQQFAVSTRQPDGRVRVVIVDRALLQAIATGGSPLARPTRVIAEPDLVPAAPGWRWCGNEARAGFVRCADGSAFPVDPPRGDGALPSELAIALAQATRAGKAPSQVGVDAPFAEALLARWQSETSVAFRRGKPWHWHQASPDAFAAALDLLPDAGTARAVTSRNDRARLFAGPLWLAGAALALHVLATAGEWTWLKLDAWRNAQEWAALVASAGLPSDATVTASSARAALDRRYGELRHAHGLPAPDDALPLLARAASALAALPHGAVRSATFADGHWTLDLVRADSAMLAELDGRLRQAGVPALTAVAGASARIRLGAQ